MVHSRFVWGFLAFLCLLLEGIALYYQYVLNYPPCVLCIHVRMLLMLFFIVTVVGWLFVKNKTAILGTLIAAMGIWVWMTERSYQLLATERGWSIGECSMESGLPAWLALEKWLPALFHIHEPCGYTPYVWMKISMAEVLMVLSVIMVVWLFCMIAVQFKHLFMKSGEDHSPN